MAQLRILFRRTLGEPDLAKSIDLHRAPTMALLLSALTSNAYGYVLWAPPATPVRATFPTMLHQGDPLPWGVENTARVHIHDGLHYGQPQIGGLTIAQVRERAKKAAKKDPCYDPSCKGDGKASQNVVTTGWGSLE